MSECQTSLLRTLVVGVRGDIATQHFNEFIFNWETVVSAAGAVQETHVSILVSGQVDSFESVALPTAAALHQTIPEPLPHEAVDDKVDGAVEDQHHVVDISHDKEP